MLIYIIGMMFKMLYALFCSLFFFFVFSVNGQEVDNQILCCEYRLVYVKDSSRMNEHSEDLMILELGKTSSKFYSYYTFLHDSLKNVDVKAGVPSMEILANRAKYGRVRSTYTVYNNYPNGKVTVVDKIGLDYYCYVEKLVIPNWIVVSEYDTVCNYRCQKALCTFKGRNYVAWFTNKIPISAGPWQFSGLPGLIMKIEDSRNQYEFVCVGLKQTRGSIIYSKKERFLVTKEEFVRTIRRYYSDPYGFLESTSGAKVSGGNRSARPYNPIDLTQ